MDIDEKRNIFEIQVELNSKLDLVKIFGNRNPVHLEIGCGRGEFIVQKASGNPETNFLGIEIKEKRIKTILRKLDIKVHRNVRLLQLNVDEKIIEFFPEESFRMIYIIHPDPWPKKKHHKNRLIQNTFIDALYKILQPDGILKIATDHEEYGKRIIYKFNNRKDFISKYNEGFTKNPDKDHIETHFEKKKREEGFEPFFMNYRKI